MARASCRGAGESESPGICPAAAGPGSSEVRVTQPLSGSGSATPGPRDSRIDQPDRVGGLIDAGAPNLKTAGPAVIGVLKRRLPMAKNILRALCRSPAFLISLNLKLIISIHLIFIDRTYWSCLIKTSSMDIVFKHHRSISQEVSLSNERAPLLFNPW